MKSGLHCTIMAGAGSLVGGGCHIRGGVLLSVLLLCWLSGLSDCCRVLSQPALNEAKTVLFTQHE